MIDIHTHLYWESYDADRDEVIRRAHAVGVEKMFVIGCTLEESKQSVALAEKYPELFAVIGLHPHFFNENTFLCHSREGGNPGSEENSGSRVRPEMTSLEECRVELKKIAKNKKVIAIGECGLDYYKHGSEEQMTEGEKYLQKEGFLMQIALAEELRLPLIIHCRPSKLSMDAYEDMFDILKNHSSLVTYQLSCILHCFMANTEMTKKFLTLPNIYFSFTANITYPIKKILIGTKDDLTETVRMIPLERLFVETDCPFLAPQEKRGERNEPAYVISVLEKIASLKNIDQSSLEQSIMKNIQQIFSI